MSEKKTVRRSVAVALGIISIVLAGGLAGAFAYYIPITDEKNNTIYSLNSQVSQLNINATNLQNQIDSLNFSVTNLQNQVNNLTDILNLNKSTIWYDGTLIIVPPLELTSLEENAPYAGYVSVQVSSSQSNETVVMLIYYSEVLKYRHEGSINVGSGGTVIFPVLPSSMSIYFGPPEFLIGISYSYSANVTITYYY